MQPEGTFLHIPFVLRFSIRQIAGMNGTYTAVINQDEGWWIGWMKEVPGVNCQGRTGRSWLKISVPLCGKAWK